MSKKKKVNCIFCGGEPKKQNKEHIIPKWLLKLTGDENRIAYFGMKKENEKFPIPIADVDEISSREPSNPHRTFSFSSFKFPACKKCNDEFGILERETKPIVERLVKNNTLQKEDIPKLLDWLDKVRVGVWLGNLQLDKNAHNIKPKFAIKQRMGASDRVLMIRRIDGLSDGINLIGIDTYAFYTAPSVFCLRINEYLLYNMSSLFLLSKELGFPYYESAILDYETSHIDISLIKGTEKLKAPLPLIDSPGMSVKLYQPIFNPQAIGNDKELYSTNYIINNSLDYKNGQGDIFIGENTIRPMRKKEKIVFTKYNDLYPFCTEEKIVADVLNWQSWVLHDYFSKLDMKNLTKDQKEICLEQHEKAISQNEKYRKKANQVDFYKSINLAKTISEILK